MMKQFRLNRFLLLFFILATSLFAQDLFTSGVLDYNAGRFSEAAKSFEEYIKTAPFNVAPYQYLVNCYIELEDNSKAVKFLEGATQKFPKNIELKVTLGKLYVNGQEFHKAEKMFLKIMDVDANNVEVKGFLPKLYFNIAVLEFRSKHFKKSLKYVNKSLEYNSSIKDVWILKENSLTQLGRFEKAKFVLDEGLEKFPNDNTMLADYALILIQQNRLDEAIKKLVPVYKQNPKNLQVALQLARLYRAKNEITKAFNIYNALLKIYPKGRMIYNEMLSYFSDIGKEKEKRALYEKMENVFPNDETIKLDKIKTYVAEGNDSTAIEQYLNYLHKHPKSYETYVNLSVLYKKYNQYEQGISLLNGALSKNIRKKKIYFLLGSFYRDKKEYDSAIRVYKEYSELQPEDYQTYYEVGSCYLDKKELENAREYFEKALKINREDALSLAKISQVYDLIGSSKKAVNYSKKAFVQNIMALQKSEQSVLTAVNKSNNLSNLEIDVDKLKLFKSNIKDADEYLVSNLSDKDYLKMINNLLERFPQSALLLFYKGLYFERLNKPNVALEYYNRVISRSSKAENAHLHMANIYYMQGKLKKAILSYKRLLSIIPDEKKIYKEVINLSKEANQLNKLCDEWKNIYSTNPENKLLKEYLIFALHKADRIDEATKIINESK